MARKKPKLNLIQLDTYEEVDALLKRIAAAEREEAAIVAALNEQIDTLKGDAESKLTPLRATRSLLEQSIEAFAAERKETDFPDRKRSRTLRFGVIGYRRSTELTTKKGTKVADVIEACKKLFKGAGVRTKEEWDKDTCRTWPTEKLDQIGAEFRDKDTFFYELAEEKAAIDNVGSAA